MNTRPLLILALTAALAALPSAQNPPRRPLSGRWAVVLATHNDFYPYVENAGFEQGQANLPDAWTFQGAPFDCAGQMNCNVTGLWDPTMAFTGARSVAIQIQQQVPNQTCECCGVWHHDEGVAVVGDALYTVSAMVRTQFVPPGNGAWLRVSWSDRNGRFLREDVSPTVAPMNWAPLAVLDSVTQQPLIAAPATAAFADVYLHFCSGTVGPPATAWFDDVSFTLASPADDDAMPANALRAYGVLRRGGYSDARIRLLVFHTNDGDIRRTFGGPNLLNGPDGAPATGDEPVIDRENAQVTKASFLAALAAVRAEVARSDALRKEVVLVVSSHGVEPPAGAADVGAFSFEQTGETVSEDELAAELALFDPATRLTVCLDFCWSGLFHDALAAPNVISLSSDDGQVSHAFPECVDAKSFAPVNTGNQMTLAGMDARFGESYAVGTGGTLYRLANGAASLLRSGNETFNDIAFRPPLKEYALVVGNGGVLLKIDPTANPPAESALASGTLNGLTGVDFTPDGRYAVIVGLAGTVLLFDASDQSVTALSSGDTDDFHDVVCRRVDRPTQGAADDYYEAVAVGTNGTLDTFRGFYNDETGAEGFSLHGSCTQGAATLRGIAWDPDERYLPPAGPGAGEPSWTWGQALVAGDAGKIYTGTGADCAWTALAGAGANESLQDVVWRAGEGQALIVGFDPIANGPVARATDGKNLHMLARPLNGTLYAATWDETLPVAYTVGRSYAAGPGQWRLTWMEYLLHPAGGFFSRPFFDEVSRRATLRAAFDAAAADVPIAVGSQAGLTVQQIQNPQLVDGIGDAATFRLF